MFTVGHSIRPIDEFIGLLTAHNVQRLVDVRTIPQSRHNPQFGREQLSASLEPAGIGYTHMPGLGGLRRPRKDSTNTGPADNALAASAMRRPQVPRDACLGIRSSRGLALCPGDRYVDERMTAADFRRIALSLDGAEEGSHMGAVDFRVGGRIFAPLASVIQGFGNLMLTPEIQAEFVADAPDVFLPVAGGWGRMGATHVRLASANRDILTGALRTAWKLRVDKNAASKKTKRARRARS